MSPSYILLIYLLLAYLIGSIPFGLILGKLAGLGDIRKIGSGNIGATNMLRTGRKDIAIATLLLDGLKGWVAVNILVPINMQFFHIYENVDYSFANLPYEFYMFSGIAAVIGHIFPIWLKFKGGKGVATAIGATFALNPLIAILILVVWIVIFLITKISSLSALSGFFAALLFSLIFPNDFLYYILPVTIIIFFTHRQNIVRICKGTEHKWSNKK